MNTTHSFNDTITQESNIEICSFASHIIPDIAILNQKKNYIDLDILKTHFLNGGYLSIKQVQKILHDSAQILMKEPNLLRINKKTYLVGDIHGQFYDIVSLISKFDLTKETLLFLGDYVDRGVFSTETFLYLMLLKSYYPQNIYLLRGNHESEKMTNHFTFKHECIIKYNLDVYNSFLANFKQLPIAAVVQNKAFCCHGGISPDLVKVDEINKIQRVSEITYDGLLCDIMWSDPDENFYSNRKKWTFNNQRNCSFFYNCKHVKEFLKINNLDLIIRGHQVQQEGFKIIKDQENKPVVVTLFSAPNYCDVYQNKGSVLEFDEKIIDIHTFSEVPHPYILKDYIDGVSWSFPFVFEKCLEMANDIVSFLDKYDTCNSSSTTEEIYEENGFNLVKSIESYIEEIKVPVSIMRSERENIDELIDDEESNFIDDCVLNINEADIKDFNNALMKDAINEKKKDDKKIEGQTIYLSPSLAKQLDSNLKIEETETEDIKYKIKNLFSYFKKNN